MMRLWPKSLAGQLLLSLALALLVAQLINAAMIYRTQKQAIENQIASSAAVRLIGAWDRVEAGQPLTRGDNRGKHRRPRWMRRGRYALSAHNPITPGMRRLPNVEDRLSDYLGNNGLEIQDIAIAHLDQPMPQRRRRQLANEALDSKNGTYRTTILAAVQKEDGQWLSARYAAPPRRGNINGFLILQTLILYLVLLVPMALLIRRVSRPLRTLTKSVHEFRDRQEPVTLTPSGPQDISQLTQAFNDMSARISTMINEKDVMLGAIGHDLKTPLAALRVRLENMDDDAQRVQMIAGVEDINRTLDDILVLARVGHPMDAPEQVNLTALIQTVAEEFADLGKDVELAESPRIVMPLHITWMRRAVRNLISNAVRYGEQARISLYQAEDSVIIRIDDDGPGIAEADMARMFEPFARLESSRNLATGGSGLGLTLARAIAEQHGGKLRIANRIDDKGVVIEGLMAEFTLPRITT
ncbi:ATP-binding protein [Sphingorhabdus sp. Alg239-R122]|uniref:sensor histidine kinase n=1 Tax=Sphingorhabdus sp. Alg239-R122 TaxID=2305989 RepID=UPI0013D9C181|nr:ATP-binding protein [Sphingorhabdus sp. Alg239-R122]